MQTMSTWEMVLMGALAILVLFWAGPGVKAMLEKSRQAKERDWVGLLVPLLLVVAFVLLLMKMV
jgi:hypothetical protein